MTLRSTILSLSILGGSAGLCWWLVAIQPDPKAKPDDGRIHPVKAAVVQPQDYTVVIESRGTVRPRTESTLIAEVSGAVIEISPSLREGGFFEHGEMLLRIDPRDYAAAITVAQSQRAQAATALETEKARAEQAIDDWKRLGRTGALPPLVARKPQLDEAQARLAGADAEVERARRALERTTIVAPFAGCVMEKLADVGQVVTPGDKLALIYAVDYAEIDLPLTNHDLAFLDLPESYRGEKADPERSGPRVAITAEYGGRQFSWDGTLVRTAGAIDSRSRQLFVTAHVANPYARRENNSPPLKAGLFVEAGIAGHTLNDVFVLPRSAIRDGAQIILIDDTDRIRRRSLTIVWTTEDHVVADSGLKAGDRVCLTRLPFAIDGLRVRPTMVDLPPVTPDAPEPTRADPPLTRENGPPRAKSA